MIKRNHRHWTVHLYKLRHCYKTILIKGWTTLLLTPPTQAGAWFRHLKMHMVLGCIAWTCVNLRAWSTCRYCNLWTDVACTAFGYKVSWCEEHILVAWLIAEGLRSWNKFEFIKQLSLQMKMNSFFYRDLMHQHCCIKNICILKKDSRRCSLNSRSDLVNKLYIFVENV